MPQVIANRVRPSRSRVIRPPTTCSSSRTIVPASEPGVPIVFPALKGCHTRYGPAFSWNALHPQRLLGGNVGQLQRVGDRLVGDVAFIDVEAGAKMRILA